MNKSHQMRAMFMKEPLGQQSRFHDKDRCRNNSFQQTTSLMVL